MSGSPVVTGALVAELQVRRGGLLLDVALAVEEGETVAIVGPNGAGKSTLFRCLAGLTPIDNGRILLNGEVVDEPTRGIFIPTERRRVAVVFQDYLLFPSLSALENVAFGPRSRGVRASDARTKAQVWLDRFGVGSLASVRPSALSGGQAQRVALARAFAADAQLLLLDEPFSALDEASRAQIRTELRSVLATRIGPTLLITHDPADVEALADRSIRLDGGRIVS